MGGRQQARVIEAGLREVNILGILCDLLQARAWRSQGTATGRSTAVACSEASGLAIEAVRWQGGLYAHESRARAVRDVFHLGVSHIERIACVRAGAIYLGHGGRGRRAVMSRSGQKRSVSEPERLKKCLPS